MRDDLVTCTAALTARTLAGDVAWADRALGDLRGRRAQAFAQAARRTRSRAAARLALPARAGPQGGRRRPSRLRRADVDRRRCSPAASSTTPPRSSASGTSTAEEYATLAAAAETIAAARWSLALAGAGNLLVARRRPTLPPASPTQTQTALAETALVLSRRAPARWRAPRPSRTRPSRPTSCSRCSTRARSRLRRSRRRRRPGRLDALAPGYRALMTLRRPGLGHELTVGAHSLRAAALVMRSRARPVARALRCRRRRTAACSRSAALAHDVGKSVAGPDHPEHGAAPAADDRPPLRSRPATRAPTSPSSSASTSRSPRPRRASTSTTRTRCSRRPHASVAETCSPRCTC